MTANLRSYIHITEHRCLQIKQLTERSPGIMNKSSALIAIKLLSLPWPLPGFAPESPGRDHAVLRCESEGNRTFRAEVMAEAATVAKTGSTEPAGSRVAAPVKSTIDFG